MFKEYIAYIKDNPEGYWFKRKVFGWGWVPAKWQGWLVLFVYLFVLVSLAFTIDDNSTNREIVFMLLLPFVLLTIALIRICYKKGEKPRWQWGFPKER